MFCQTINVFFSFARANIIAFSLKIDHDYYSTHYYINPRLKLHQGLEKAASRGRSPGTHGRRRCVHMPWHRPVQRHPQASAAGDSAASRRQVPRTASLRERDGDRGRRRLTGSLGEAIIAGSGCAGHAFSSSRLGGEIRRTFTVPPGGLASSPLISFSCRASSLDGSSLRAQLACY